MVSSQGVALELAMDQPEAELAHPGLTEVSRLIKGVVPLIMELINRLTLMVVKDLPWPPCLTREALEAVAAILSLQDGLVLLIGSE